MDLQLLALIVLAILCVLQWRHSASRMQEMERKIAELAEVKDDLQRLLAKQGQQTAPAPASQTAAPQPVQEEDAPKEEPVPTHAVAAHQSVVPVGQRQPAVVAARPMATVPAEPTAPQADVSDISPEVVAVIMAAVAAYGYSPAAIRSIKAKKTAECTLDYGRPPGRYAVIDIYFSPGGYRMKKFKITVNGQAYEVEVEEIGGAAPAPAVVPTPAAPAQAPQPAAPAAPAAAPAPAAAAPSPAAMEPIPDGAVVIKAPMPGKISALKAEAGQAVKRGDVLLVLEAMKMQNDITATAEGKLHSLRVNVGDNVKTGDALAVIVQ